MHLHRSLRMAPWAAALVVTAGLATNPLDAAGEKRVDFGTQTGFTQRHPGVLGVSAAFAINNAQLCVAPNDQTAPFYLPDGNGGGIAVWSDGREGNYDVYAQRLDASGTPAWTSRRCCSAPTGHRATTTWCPGARG